MNYKYDNLREDILQFIPKDSNKILDIGCGAGKLIEKLQSLGNECYGIEQSKDAYEVAIYRLGNANKIINKRIEDAIDDIPNNYFDVILFLDVLEHMIEPWEILKQIKIKLNNSGIIICSIPNIRYFHNLYDLVIKKEFEYKEYGVMDKTHLRFFTYKSMQKMFEQAGLKISDFVGINPTPSKKMKLINLATFGFFRDCKFQQFVIISKPI